MLMRKTKLNLLSSLKTHPLWDEPRTLAGIALVLLSYIFSWPLIGLLGFVAARMDNPDLLIAGGPALYLFSYILFIAGIYLAGKKAAFAVMNRSIASARRLLLVAFK